MEKKILNEARHILNLNRRYDKVIVFTKKLIYEIRQSQGGVAQLVRAQDS